MEGAGHRGRARVEEAPEAEVEDQEEDAEVARAKAEEEDVAAEVATPAALECPKSLCRRTSKLVVPSAARRSTGVMSAPSCPPP